jgi:hypothetical protein
MSIHIPYVVEVTVGMTRKIVVNAESKEDAVIQVQKNLLEEGINKITIESVKYI